MMQRVAPRGPETPPAAAAGTTGAYADVARARVCVGGCACERAS